MKFIDLFAGLGGFHSALKQLNHECVFACEIAPDLRELYSKNFNMPIEGDIRKISIDNIPDYDILCAGFPCQPYSKAGEQKGTAHREGDLFDYALALIDRSNGGKRPQYIILENVSNLENHDGGKTWQNIKSKLESFGYQVAFKHLSPHEFGVPQIRKRMFIVASLSGLAGFNFPSPTNQPPDIHSILEENPVEVRPLSPQVQSCLEIWQEFLDLFPADEDFPYYPIWAMEFGATYPYETATPFAVGIEELRHYSGSFGCSLEQVANEEIFNSIPSHARVETPTFPAWKIDFIKRNRLLYEKHKSWIDNWLPNIKAFPSSLQKLEWNCKGEPRVIRNNIIRFRPSGVRVKRPTTAPSLTTINTQLPIIGWLNRYMTIRECANLQSMGILEYLPATYEKASDALGNAVNVTLVRLIAQSLLRPSDTSRLASALADYVPEVQPTLFEL